MTGGQQETPQGGNPKFRLKFTMLVILLAAGSILPFYFSEFTSDIRGLIPEKSTAGRIFNTIREEKFAGRIGITLSVPNGVEGSDILPKAADEFIKSLDDPAIVSAMCRIKMPEREWMLSLPSFLPSLADKKMLYEAEKLFSNDAIRRSMRTNLNILATPGGIAAADFIAADPLGTSRLILGKMDELRKIFRYSVDENGMFTAQDGKKALILLETNSDAADSQSARRLLDYIDAKLAALPQPVKGEAVTALKHAIDNEDTLRRDFTVLGIASPVLFVLIFILLYGRDFRSLFIILMPVAGILSSVLLISLFTREIPLLIIAMGGVIGGIAVDYGIHVYALCRRPETERRLKAVFAPLAAAAATTTGIFITFFFSGAKGYVFLALFAILSITLSFVFSYYFLPDLIGRNPTDKKTGLPMKSPWESLSVFAYRSGHAKLITALWAVFITACLLFSVSSLKISLDMRTMDAVSKKTLESEKEFSDLWLGGKHMGIIIAKSDSKENALRLSEQLNEAADKNGIAGKINLLSAAPLMPSAQKAAENRRNFKSFMTTQKYEHIRDIIREEALKNEFNTDAFDGFLKVLSGETQPDSDASVLPESIAEKFIVEKNGSWRAYSYFSDTPENYESVLALAEKFQDVSVISYSGLEKALGEESAEKLTISLALAGLFILIIAVISLRSVRLGLVSILPTTCALISICGTMALFSIPLSIPSLIAMIIVTGLSVDYGIYQTFKYFKDWDEDITAAMILSAVTTVAGGATVLLAKHPFLFGIGIVMMTGLTAALVSALTLIPAIAELKEKDMKKKALAFIFSAGVIALASSCSTLEDKVKNSPLLEQGTVPSDYNPPGNAFSIVATMTFEIYGREFPALIMLEADPATRRIAFVGMQKAGVKIIEILSENGKITSDTYVEDLEKIPDLPKNIITDMEKICFNLDRGSAGKQADSILNFDAPSGYLISKSSAHSEKNLWKILFLRYRIMDSWSVPTEIYVENTAPEYRILIRVLEFKTQKTSPEKASGESVK